MRRFPDFLKNADFTVKKFNGEWCLIYDTEHTTKQQKELVDCFTPDLRKFIKIDNGYTWYSMPHVKSK